MQMAITGSAGAARRAAALLVHSAEGLKTERGRSWRDLKWTIDIDPLEVV